MELADYLSIMRRRWLSISALTILGVLAALVFSMAQTPQFTARAQVFVSVRGADTTGEMLQGANFTIRAVRSYTQLVSTPRVLQPVIDELGLDTTPSALASHVRADSPLDTVLINVSADNPSPQLAADIANATARSLSSTVTELETPASGGDSPVQISTVRSAIVPTAPSSPNTTLNLALGFLVGLALGVGVAVLAEVLNTKLRDVNDVSALGVAPIVGAITFESDAQNHPLILQESPQSPRSESFRRLRTNLQFLDLEERGRAFLLTSSLAGEGKSTTTINLAITLASAGQRVVIVDADLRRPSAAKYMGLEGEVGLTTVLIGRATLDDVIQPWGNGNLDVITSGQTPPNPSELLGSERMSGLLDTLLSRYDIVLIDSPPLLPVTDSAVLARLIGRAVLVVGANTIHRQQLLSAAETLAAVGATVQGMVVNRVPVKGAGSYAYSYYEYTTPTPAPAKKTGLGKILHGSAGSTPPVGHRKPSTPDASHRRPAGRPDARDHDHDHHHEPVTKPVPQFPPIKGK